MSSTALVTFLFQAPRPVARVELLGSWDNFGKPYPMQRDRSLGNLDWRGCHSFTGITFDDLHGNAAKRDGALKMGGTYWYYYRLDDDFECHNPAEPCTSSCPLLPGQCVNVLEVPVQYVHPSSAASTSVASLEEQVFTLDPTDKFVSPQPPSPEKPKRLRLRMRKTGVTSEDDFNSVKFARLTKATWSILQSRPDRLTQRRPLSQRAKTSVSVQSWPWKSEEDRNTRPYHSAGAHAKAWIPRSRLGSVATSEAKSYESMPCSDDAETSSHDLSNPQDGRPVHSSVVSISRDSIEVSASMDSHSISQNLSTKDQIIGGRTSPESYFENDRDCRSLSRESYDPLFGPQPEMPAETTHEPVHPSATSSKRTSVFSLLESMTGHTDSPEHRLSQPITPSVSEFGEFVLDAFKLDDTPTEDLYPSETVQRRSGFSGYNLSAADHASTITLRAAPNPSLRKRLGDAGLENTQRVEKWDDGAEQPQKSALQDLVDEMGYLSSLIG